MDTPSLGRIVRYVLPAGPNAGQERAAIITKVYGEGVCNLTVFYDQEDDAAGDDAANDGLVGRVWSPAHDDFKSPGTWHWPERV